MHPRWKIGQKPPEVMAWTKVVMSSSIKRRPRTGTKAPAGAWMPPLALGLSPPHAPNYIRFCRRTHVKNEKGGTGRPLRAPNSNPKRDCSAASLTCPALGFIQHQPQDWRASAPVAEYLPHGEESGIGEADKRERLPAHQQGIWLGAVEPPGEARRRQGHG